MPTEDHGRTEEDDEETSAEPPPYDEWQVDDLRGRAAEVGIPGRWDMDRDQLIDALRNR